MKIVVTGTRGIPGIQGGVETHCEELYPRLAAMGHDVTVICRSCYVEANHPDRYKGVKLLVVKAPRRKSLEAIIHTFRAVWLARKLKPDLIHIHAVGPAIVVPFARLLGLKVVMTNHGPDYERQKWGRVAKFVIKTGERWATHWSNRIIVISNVIAKILETNYGRTDTTLIFNGVPVPVKSTTTDYVESLGLAPNRYVVALGRFVKEKGFHDLIRAFAKSSHSDFHLAIAGDADHPDRYSESLKALARSHGVVLTGFIRGEKLNQLMTNAALFVLPSYHEGLPISLLEAMSYGLNVAVSDIPANRIPAMDNNDFFAPGDTDALARLIERKLESPARRSYDLSPYNWDTIARQTETVYLSLLPSMTDNI